MPCLCFARYPHLRAPVQADPGCGAQRAHHNGGDPAARVVCPRPAGGRRADEQRAACAAAGRRRALAAACPAMQAGGTWQAFGQPAVRGTAGAQHAVAAACPVQEEGSGAGRPPARQVLQARMQSTGPAFIQHGASGTGAGHRRWVRLIGERRGRRPAQRPRTGLIRQRLRGRHWAGSASGSWRGRPAAYRRALPSIDSAQCIWGRQGAPGASALVGGRLAGAATAHDRALAISHMAVLSRTGAGAVLSGGGGRSKHAAPPLGSRQSRRMLATPWGLLVQRCGDGVCAGSFVCCRGLLVQRMPLVKSVR